MRNLKSNIVLRRKAMAIAQAWEDDHEWAREQLEALGDQAVPALIEIMARARRAPTTIGLMVLTYLIGLVALCSLTAYFNVYHNLRFPSPAMPVLMPLIMIVSIRTLYASLYHRNAAKALAVLQSAQSIGPLLPFLGSGDTYVRSATRETLFVLIPRMTPDDFAAMSPVDQKNLVGLIAGDDVDLARSVLGSAGAIPASVALPYVERLAAKACGSAAPQEELVAEAYELLPSLRDRADREKLGSSLLRPATADGAGDLLVRPASGTPAKGQPNLLRPTESSS